MTPRMAQSLRCLNALLVMLFLVALCEHQSHGSKEAEYVIENHAHPTSDSINRNSPVVAYEDWELDHGDFDSDPNWELRMRGLIEQNNLEEEIIIVTSDSDDGGDEWEDDETDDSEELEEDESEDELEITTFEIDIGVPQRFDPEIMSAADFSMMHKWSVEHLTALAENPELAHILPDCKLKDPLCFQEYHLKDFGDDFTDYKDWMTFQCCPLSLSGAYFAFLKRCPIPPDAVNVWQSGDVNKFFTNLTTLPAYKTYSPTIYSQPTPGTDDAPWVVTLENVISYEEAQRIIAWGDYKGWEISLDPGPMNEDGTSQPIKVAGRTSRQAWCDHGCLEDPMVRGVVQRIANLTGIPETNSDFLQLLKYRQSQFYFEHHDSHDFQVHSATGHRIMTVMLYLADLEADQDGGTNFPRLNVTVQPKMGRMLLWPNVLDSDPNRWDPRLHHQALPVKYGIKYAATAWLHMRDFKGPAAVRCDED